MTEVSTKNSLKAGSVDKSAVKPGKVTTGKAAAKIVTLAAAKVPLYDEVKPLLQKNTCLSCHNPNTRQVGPAFKDIAKRKYSVEQIMALIKNPKPEHWPDYSTPMPPMPQVSAQDARKIAIWITLLK